MARETTELKQLLEGAMLAAGIGVGIQAFRRYRRRRRDRDGAAVVCAKCGETQRLADFLDPTVTCACAASSGQRM